MEVTRQCKMEELMNDLLVDILGFMLEDHILQVPQLTWCCSQPGGVTEPGEKTPPVVAKLSKPKRNVAAVIHVPFYSTKEDVKDFNNYYLEQFPPPTYLRCL